MILPLQRICKYPLFFRELLKNTEDLPEEEKNLEAAEKTMKEIVKHANERTRKMENVQKMLEVQTSFDFSSLEDRLMMNDTITILTTHRSFVSQTPIKYMKRGESLREAALFLFSDLVVVCSPEIRKSYLVKRLFPLDSIIFRRSATFSFVIEIIAMTEFLLVEFLNEGAAAAWMKEAQDLAEKRFFFLFIYFFLSSHSFSPSLLIFFLSFSPD